MNSDQLTTAACLDRSTPSEAVQQQHASWFGDHVASLLARDLAAPTDRIEFEPAGTGEGVERSVWDKYRFRSVMTAMDLTVREGCWIVGTPYDLDWQVGSGLSPYARYDGKFSIHTSSGANGFSGAGVGLYLSSPTPADVTVTPNGDYGFSNLVFGPTPSLFSQGGLGITVYLNEDKSPIFLRLVQLWDNRGNIYTGPLVRDDRGNVVRLPDDAGTGTGSIAAAASPPTPGTFRIPLAPILLRLQPGNRYLMWVWCWQRIHSRMDEATYFSALDVRMPAVTVCAGPPIVGPR